LEEIRRGSGGDREGIGRGSVVYTRDVQSADRCQKNLFTYRLARLRNRTIPILASDHFKGHCNMFTRQHSPPRPQQERNLRTQDDVITVLSAEEIQRVLPM
jgi:hypothetical protein